MAAPKGNNFWEKRSKHGRDKLFESPELLWEAACEYFEDCQATPWVRKDWVAGGREVEHETAKPFSLSGLCLYLGCAESYFRVFKKGNPSEDFLTVIARIEGVIATQQFEGAAVGAYNGNIISRMLGLVDKTEVSKHTQLEDMTDEELLEHARKIQKAQDEE